MCVIERENNMFETDTKPRTQNDLVRIKALYNRAFPENERRPFDDMMASLNNRLELNVFYAEGAFVGFAFLLNCGDISHIIYFAVEEEMRGQGMGSAALKAMRAENPGMRMLVDIERDIPGAPNAMQRCHRKHFYLRSGYQETQVKYEWRGEQYEILSNGGDVSDAEFWNFWDTLEKEMDVSEL